MVSLRKVVLWFNECRTPTMGEVRTNVLHHSTLSPSRLAMGSYLAMSLTINSRTVSGAELVSTKPS